MGKFEEKRSSEDEVGITQQPLIGSHEDHDTRFLPYHVSVEFWVVTCLMLKSVFLCNNSMADKRPQ